MDIITGLIVVAALLWLVRVEYRIVRWFFEPVWLLARAIWHGLAWVAARIRRQGKG
ncbi:MAG TPA: hypothetical protein VF292_14060 [Rhodanobacteraceae bacterium]